jgi:hypothetical protein
MKMNGKRVFLSLIFCLLISMSVLVFLSVDKSEVHIIPELEAMLPRALPGWEVEDLPVGETEEVKQKMGELLNYDAAIFREYSKGVVKVQVYISYWSAGKAHYRLVYGHTPDICWVNAGWIPRVQNPSYHYRLPSDETVKFKEAQYREFEIGKEYLRVLFWQLLDGEPFTYGNFTYPPATAMFTDIFKRGFDQKPEQWFIRVSANVDFERLKTDMGFQELMSSMSNFELIESAGR